MIKVGTSLLCTEYYFSINGQVCMEFGDYLNVTLVYFLEVGFEPLCEPGELILRGGVGQALGFLGLCGTLSLCQ